MFINEKVCISLEFDDTLTSIRINTSSHPEDSVFTSKRDRSCICEDTVIRQKINMSLEFKDTVTNLSVSIASEPEDISIVMSNDEFSTFDDIVICGLIKIFLEISDDVTNLKITTFSGREDKKDDIIGIFLKIKDKIIKEQIGMYMEFDESLIGVKVGNL